MTCAVGRFRAGGPAWGGLAAGPVITCLAAAAGAAEPVADAFDRTILPLLRDHYLPCHSADSQAGELDLERFTSVAAVRQDVATWQHVLE